MPEKAIQCAEAYLKSNQKKYVSSALLVSVGAAYCDLEDYDNARKCANRAYAIEGEAKSLELQSLYARLKKYENESAVEYDVKEGLSQGNSIMEDSFEEEDNEVVQSDEVEDTRIYNTFFENETDRKLNNISITYFERLLANRHPVYNTIIEDDSVLVNENVKRCLTFVLGVLKKVETIGGFEGRQLKVAAETKSTNAKSGNVDCDENGDIRMAKMVEIANLYYRKTLGFDKKISVNKISNWLLKEGYLEFKETENGRHYRVASKKGIKIGMKNKLVSSAFRDEYETYVFTDMAQKFICENILDIASFRK